MNVPAYRDMIYLSRPLSRHPKMSVENRAKLFAPFAALRGFDIEILTKEQDQLLGEYAFLSATVKKVDDVEQLLVLEGASIPFGNTSIELWRKEGRRCELSPQKTVRRSGGHPLHRRQCAPAKNRFSHRSGV